MTSLTLIIRGIVGFFVMLIIGLIFASSLFMVMQNLGYVYFLEKSAENQTIRIFFVVGGIAIGSLLMMVQSLLVKALVDSEIKNSIAVKEKDISEYKFFYKEYAGSGVTRTRYGISMGEKNYFFKQWFRLNKPEIVSASDKNKEFPTKKSSMSKEKQKEIDSYYENYFKDKLMLLEIETALAKEVILVNKEKNIAVKIDENKPEIPELSLINWIIALPLFLCAMLTYVGVFGNDFKTLIILAEVIGFALIIKLFRRSYVYIDEVVKCAVLKKLQN